MHRAVQQKQTGFTIVELLIVIVVIGILAAITIVAYNGIQNRAKASSAQSAAGQAVKKILAYSIDNSDNYPATLAAAGVADANNTTYQYSVNNTASPKTYCVTATTADASYYMNNTTQASPAAGACPGHGQNGIAAITNLVSNPSLETNLTGWGNLGCSSISRDTTIAKNGSASAKCISNTTGVQYFSGPVAAVGPGETYRVSAWVRSDQTRQVEIYLAAQDATSVELQRINSNYVNLTPNTWVLATATGTTPAGTARMIAQVNFRNSIVGENSWVDSALYTASSNTYNYADGSSTNWIWNGTANNSTSTGPPL
ncbi:MAG: prepilin-type N-terminal cleavage/methylation protein [Candidatus Saccharibacteria bacterium]|nr:prepilin-type N-terminal cleavage/methylation protein [Candidatus Saccharibacteria bacterium]